MKNILWLASWYPSDNDPYSGDFIERHAQAAMLFNKIHVLFVTKAKIDSGPVYRQVTRSYPQGGSATIIYFRTATSLKRLIPFRSIFIYLQLHRRFIKQYIRENGKPDGIHVHVGMKAGLAALYIKYFFGLHYVISEHWSGLYSEARPNLVTASFLFRWCWKLIMKNAVGYSAVSDSLATAMRGRFKTIKKLYPIPNSVDPSVFFPADIAPDPNKFVHISALNYPKNIKQILEAASLVKKKLPDFKLIVFGEPGAEVKKWTEIFALGTSVEFMGLHPQEVLRDYIQRSSALILYSTFETFGCVIIEANACGRPVIVSEIPVFHENVLSGKTGIFVPLDDPAALAASIVEMSKQTTSFKSDEIVQWVSEKYFPEIIGKAFNAFYSDHF